MKTGPGATMGPEGTQVQVSGGTTHAELEGRSMKTRRGAIGALILGAFLAALIPAGAARAASVYPVELGEFLEGSPSEVMRMFPERLTVHPGDILHFTNQAGTIPETGIHLVGLLPAGQEVDAFNAEFGTEPDDPWAAFVADPDETPERAEIAYKLNPDLFWPSNLACGSAENPCVFDGTGEPGDMFTSGALFIDPLDFRVEIAAEPGTTLWAFCPFHPELRLRIDVVGPDEPASDPAVVEEARQRDLARYTAIAAKAHKQYLTKRVGHRAKDGSTVWEAWPGVEIGPVALFAMYPKTLEIRAGDSVRWNFEPRGPDAHSVTFPLERGLEIHNEFISLWCDLDGDAGTQPDVEALPAPPFCPLPTVQLELDISHDFLPPAGDSRYLGDDDEFDSSGIRAIFPGLTNANYEMRFDATSGAGGFSYVCVMHGGPMTGKIVVD